MNIDKTIKCTLFAAIALLGAGVTLDAAQITGSITIRGGAHLDTATLASMSGIIKSLGGIVREGIAAGRFQPVNPLLVHAGIVGPILLYFASSSMRVRLQRGGVPGASMVSRDEVVAHVQRVALMALEGRTA